MRGAVFHNWSLPLLLVIAGAGASYDSVSSRLPGTTALEAVRLPLADELFAPRPMFEAVQRDIPQVLQVASQLYRRGAGESVEDVLARFTVEATHNAHRPIQLAAVKYYLQGIISRCERDWYRDMPVSTNMMELHDQIENARRERQHPAYVTFNYDRLIEFALTHFGQRFASLEDYVRPAGASLFKLHGSVDWARTVGRLEVGTFGGSAWNIASEIAERVSSLEAPGAIIRTEAVPSSNLDGQIALPALAIPVRAKDRFECPESHVVALRAILPQVRAIVTIGWRAGEEHFLHELHTHVQHKVEVICVGGTPADAEATVKNLRRGIRAASYETFGAGFSEFLRHRRIQRLLNVSWVD